MYKKLLFFIAIFAFSVALSGCTKYSTTFEITKNDEVIITQQNALSIDLYKAIDYEYDSSDPFKNWDKLFNKKLEERYINKGFTIKNIIDDKYIGKELQKKFKHAKFFFSDSLPPGYLITADSDLPVVIKRCPFKTFYSIHLSLNPKKLKEASKEAYGWHSLVRINALKAKQANNTSKNTGNDTKNQDSKKETDKSNSASSSEEKADLLAMPEITDLTIKIPVSATNHNATSVDTLSNTYTWKISETNEYKNMQNVNIILEYEVTNKVNIVILTLILLITLIIVFANRKSKKVQSDESESAF